MAVNRVSVEAIDPLGKSLGWRTISASRLAPAIIGPPGRRLAALFSGGLARSLVNGKILIGGGLLKGSAPSTVRKVCSSGGGGRRGETLVTGSALKGAVRAAAQG